MLVTVALAAATGCGGDDEPTAAEDEADITAVVLQDELGGAERCSQIYTDSYLAENWNENVTAYPGTTPLEKCENDPPLEGVTEADVKISVDAIEGDTAVASSKVRAGAAVAFTLVREDEGWRIAGFAD